MKSPTIQVAFLIAISLVTPILPASAEEYLEGRASYTQMEERVAGQYQQALDKMTHSYNILAEILEKVGMAKLNESQATWQKFSAADCKFTTDYSRGEPLEKLINQDCLTSMTEDRAAALEYQIRRNVTLDPYLALAKHKK